MASTSRFNRPAKAAETTLDRLIRLDSWVKPGLSEAEFRRLFYKCKCGLITTRRIFDKHTCTPPRQPSIVIDLTSDDSSSDVENSGAMVIDLSVDSDEDS